ncbi:MAG: hypothetical protein ACYSYL_00225 [Planctomycetota bacterium]|jgi:redox-regulated HSP33 family molecular chaperone
MSKQRFQGWIASLNDGNTVFESEPVPGQISPWQALLQHCRSGQASITQLQLQRGGTTVVAVTRRNSFVRGYFHAREARMSNVHRTTVDVQGIGTVIGDLVFITWLNQQGQVWQDVRPLQQMRIHTCVNE